MNTNLIVRAMCVSICVLGTVVFAGGCMKQRRGVNMAERIENAPPIRIDDSQDVHILVMQAPHAGWSFSIEKDEPTPKGKRVYITMWKPDPTMIYPQMIVEKSLRTDVRADTPIEIYGRMINFKESTRDRGYAPIKPVDSFEQ